MAKASKKKKKKDSLAWLEELVESVKKWRAQFGATDRDIEVLHPTLRKMADAVDGYTQAIKEEVEAELDAEETPPYNGEENQEALMKGTD